MMKRKHLLSRWQQVIMLAALYIASFNLNGYKILPKVGLLLAIYCIYRGIYIIVIMSFYIYKKINMYESRLYEILSGLDCFLIGVMCYMILFAAQ